MLSRILTGLLLLIALWQVRGQDSSGVDQPRRWFFKGYVKNLQTGIMADKLATLSLENILHNRLNLKWQPSDNWTCRLEMRNRLFWGEQTRLLSGLGRQLDADPGYFDLSFVPFDQDGVIFHSVFDRASVSWNHRQWEVTLGRQRINWGMATTWNPNDLFNAYNFFDFDYEERPGTDALRVNYAPTDWSSVEIAVAPGRYDSAWTAAGLYRFNKSGYDVQLLAGYYRGYWTAGAGFAGDLGKTGVKGEVTLFYPERQGPAYKTSVSATLGLDYSFGEEWFVSGSVLYLSSVQAGNVATLFNTASSLDARQLLPFRWSLLGGISKSVNPLLTLSANLIYGNNGQTLIAYPVVSYNIRDNWDLDFVIQAVFSEKATGSWGTYASLGLGRLRWSF